VDPGTGQGDFYTGYGYLWWTGQERVGAATVAVYMASGNGGQKVFVVPSLDLAVVVTSRAYGQARGQRRSHALIRQILAATQ
jgi:CubicO group peptidase (beta-lactamase class C family)